MHKIWSATSNICYKSSAPFVSTTVSLYSWGNLAKWESWTQPRHRGQRCTVPLNKHLTRSCQTASSFLSDRTPLADYCVVDMMNRTVHQLSEVLECFPVDGQWKKPPQVQDVIAHALSTHLQHKQMCMLCNIECVHHCMNWNGLLFECSKLHVQWTNKLKLCI